MRKTLQKAILTLSLLLATGYGARAALPETFVDTSALAALAPKAVVVDVRNKALYLLGHIDGALNIPQDDFLETRRGVKSLVPSPKAWEELLGRNGITPETTVVAYADSKNPYAARLVWSLRYYGHKKAYVLDGGYEKWKNEGRPTAYLPTSASAPATYRIPGFAPLRAEADNVLTRLGTSTAVIWDTRSRGEYLGTDVRADRGGHIPGATHLEWTELQVEVDGAKVLADEKTIRDLLQARGITPEKEIIAHCQTGIRSSYATLVLTGYGYAHAENYDGSWIEWGNDKSLPIEQGAGNTN